jgi:F-type H+-transporting ATPase subunit b
MEQARGAIASAEAETGIYEDKLRAARAEIYAAREKLLKQWNAERDAALEHVRNSTKERVLTARLEIEQSASDARKQIEGQSDELSARVLNAVLPAGVIATEVAQ